MAKAYERSGHLILSLNVLHLWKELMATQLEERAKELVASRAAPSLAPKKDTAASLFDDDDSFSSGYRSGPSFGGVSGGADDLFGSTGGDDLDWGQPLDDFNADPLPDTGFKLSLFSAPPKPTPVFGDEFGSAGEPQSAEGGNGGSQDPLTVARKDALAEFVEREEQLKGQQALVAMKLLTTVMKGASSLESPRVHDLLVSSPDFAYNLPEWITALAEATNVHHALLNKHIVEYCSHFEKLRAYSEFVMSQ